MRNLFTIAFMLVCTTICAQDTTVVMITLNEILYFDWGKPTEVLDRVNHKGKVEFEVQPDTVVCLHLYDQFERWRDISSVSLTGVESDHVQGTVASTAVAYYCLPNTNGIEVSVSKARRKR